MTRVGGPGLMQYSSFIKCRFGKAEVGSSMEATEIQIDIQAPLNSEFDRNEQLPLVASSLERHSMFATK